MVMFWVAILAISVLLYVLLDGFDLGVGILFGVTRSEAARRSMMSAVAPVWDGNETWLVVVGVVLWGAFPIVYSVLFSAFYLPLLLMLAGLILRGVAFEYRAKTERMRWLWDASFGGGSFLVAFMQGLTVGALVEGLPISRGQYAGGDFGWFSPFAVLCGVGLCLGYALLGACWLVKKCEGEVREGAYRQIPYLALGLLVFLIVVFAYALAEHLPVMARWIERPYLFDLPSHRRPCSDRTRLHRSASRRRPAFHDGRADLSRGIRHTGDLLLALHDPVLDHHRAGRRPAFESRLHVLGRRAFRLSNHAPLHRDQPDRVQRKSQSNCGAILRGIACASSPTH